MFKNKYVLSTLLGGVIGASSVYFLTTENGKKVRRDVTNKIQQLDSSRLIGLVAEISKDWTEFGDVVNVKTDSSS